MAIVTAIFWERQSLSRTQSQVNMKTEVVAKNLYQKKHDYVISIDRMKYYRCSAGLKNRNIE